MTNITVFTASYNYGHLLRRVYQSLLNQTRFNFEWIIVDDCSTDNTGNIVEEWLKNDNPFPILYYRQDVNKGKMAAMNRGVKLAQYDLFLSIDADDELLPEAIESFTNAWESLNKEQQESIYAIYALCQDQHGNTYSTPYPSEPVFWSYYDALFKYGTRGDTIEMFRTSVLKEYPYYEKIDRHVIHSATYFDMSEKYKFMGINKVLRVYYRLEEGRETLSSRSGKLKFLKGRQFYAQQRINRYLRRLPRDGNKKKIIVFKVTTFLSYIRYSHHIGLSLREMFLRIEPTRYKLVFILAIIPSWILIIQDRLKGRV